MTGAYYGVAVAVLMLVLGRWAPQPAGSIVLWSMLSAQAALTLWIMWHRLRLRWYSAGCLAALLGSLAMIPVSARGLDLATMITELPLPIPVAIWSAILFIPLAIGLESLRDSPEWRALSAQTKRASLWEMITFRHVPHSDRKSAP